MQALCLCIPFSVPRLELGLILVLHVEHFGLIIVLYIEDVPLVIVSKLENIALKLSSVSILVDLVILLRQLLPLFGFVWKEFNPNGSRDNGTPTKL